MVFRSRDERARVDVAATRVNDALPVGLRIAGAWSWRVLVIAGVIGVIVFIIIQLRYIVIPLMIAILLAALLVPFSQWLQRHRWPRWLAITVAEVGLLAVVTALVYLVVTQISAGFPALRDTTIERYEDFKGFLLGPPLYITESELNGYLADAWESIQRDSGWLVSGALSVGTGFGHFAAGVLLVLFATLFILIDGHSIWRWIVRVFPRQARPAMVGAGEAGWLTLTTFVKVQIFVAFVDAVGIGIGAAILQLPLVIPIAVAVFLGSFVPIVGAVVTGALAVFIALIYHNIVIALIMLGIVLLVQQIEGHVLQPLVMGTAVKVHPLAVVLAVAAGGFVAGIPGTLFAVPIVAVLNVMIAYIVSGRWRTHPHPTLKDVITDA